MLQRKDAMIDYTPSKSKVSYQQQSGIFGQVQDPNPFKQAAQKPPYMSGFQSPIKKQGQTFLSQSPSLQQQSQSLFQQSKPQSFFQQPQQLQPQQSLFNTPSLGDLKLEQPLFQTKPKAQQQMPTYQELLPPTLQSQQGMFQPQQQQQQQQSLFQQQPQQSMFQPQQQQQAQSQSLFNPPSQSQSPSQSQTGSLFPGLNLNTPTTTFPQSQQSSWLNPSVIQTTNPQSINPSNLTWGLNNNNMLQNMQNAQNMTPPPLLGPHTPTPEQLSQLFVPKQIVPQSITNKELTLLNNPSLKESENQITEAISKWLKDMMMNNLKTSATELLNAPLVELLAPPSIRPFLPVLYREPTFIMKVPEIYNKPKEKEQVAKAKTSKLPLLDIDFSSCRHLSSSLTDKQKPTKVAPYTSIYKEIHSNPTKRRSQRPDYSSNYDPYESVSKSMFSLSKKPVTTTHPNNRTRIQDTKTSDDNDNDSSDNIFNCESLYNKNEQTILPSIKQLPIIHEFLSSPSLQKLSKFTREDLKHVYNLRIHNSYGSVEFANPVNLLNLNVDSLITIEPNLIEIKSPLMNENVEKGGNNIYLTFYNFSKYLEKAKGKPAVEKRFREAMEKKIEHQGMVFVEFEERTGNLTVMI